jgi:protein gp37
MAETSIEWTAGDDGTPGKVWNPTTGCDRISTGCDRCYALTLAKRLKGMGSAKYQNDGDPHTSGPGFGLTVHEDALSTPFTWRKPTRVFVNSMSDLFHARVPLEFVQRVFDVIERTPQHTYIVLTKRASRLPRIADRLPWPANLWMGVSVEDADNVDRIDDLRQVPAAVRLVSAEPLVGDLGAVDLTGIHWLIAGAESGKGARPVEMEWLRSLRDRCEASGTAYFVKQLGAAWARDTFVAGQSVARTDPKGVDWAHWPADLRIRQFPRQPEAVSVGA